ncbi:MAG: ATP-binding protein [Candidatus Sulfotelmatobacter sp.]|jgi:ATP-dependent DNA helicase RecG
MEPDEEQLTLRFDVPLALVSPTELYQHAEALLEVLKEDRRFERKSAKATPRLLGEYLSMWANTAPDGGLIALGIEDKGKIIGCRALTQTELNEREQAGKVYCPDARPESRLVPVVNADGENDYVLLFRVPYRPDRVVYDSQGDAWIRVGDQKRKLSKEECAELERDKGQVDFEQEAMLEFSYPEDFDTARISQFAKSFAKRRMLTYEKSDEQIMALRHLGKFENGVFVPNIACVLLFAKDLEALRKFPGCRVRVRRFEGEQEQTGANYNAVKDYWIEGNIPAIIEGTARVLESQIREFSRLGADGHFIPHSEYPHDAWFEALVNACVHRSYGMRNMHITVEMFYDRLVIESPGAFPPFVTPENIYDTQHARNPKLMDAMIYLGFVQFANEGTKRIRDEMLANKLPVPLFEQKEIAGGYSVRVTLRNNYKQREPWIDSDVSTILGEDLSKALTPEESRAINYIQQHGQINVSQFHNLVSSTVKTWHTCRKILFGLEKKGILEYKHRTDILKDPKACFVLDARFRRIIRKDSNGH